MGRYFIASRRGMLPAGGTVRVRFYAELNEHIARPLRGHTFDQALAGRTSAKSLIESLGVPHTEVEVVLINGRSVELDALLQDGDMISIYPTFEALDVSPLLRLRPRPLRITRFVLDGHLGRLARYLRVLGFDTLYEADCPDEELARCSRDQHRILLTRDRGLLRRSAITHGSYVYATDPVQQLFDVVERFQLQRSIAPFRRCPVCNEQTVRASKRALENELDAKLLARHSLFRRCRGCGRVYWQGTHHARLQQLVNAVKVTAF